MAEISTNIQKAIALLIDNEVIGFPTETVYGLAGNALSESAVLKIFDVKQRPKFDPLILHTSSIQRIEDFVLEIPDVAYQLFERFSPGPITILLPKKSNIPDIVTSGLSQVAIRIPNHPLALNLLQKLPFPLAAPSANPFGYISPTSAQHVDNQLGTKIKLILDGGESGIGVESTIIGFEKKKPVIFRLGGLSIEEIEEVTGKLEVRESSSSPAAPGMLKSHYAPQKPFLLGDINELLNKNKGKKIGLLSFRDQYKFENSYILSTSGNFLEASKNLFKYLRILDESNVDIILAELVPDQNLGKAINDRLRRAA
ncbi:MAG: L-threonylcarbamoyladenylate synthase, partial [Cytophagales bacterium]